MTNFQNSGIVFHVKQKTFTKEWLMQIERSLYVAQLYDVYGALLTEKQAYVVEACVLKDVSFAELASLLGSTRQAVYDMYTKAEQQLYKFESVLHIVSSKQKLQQIKQKLLQCPLSSKAEAMVQSINKIFEE